MTVGTKQAALLQLLHNPLPGVIPHLGKGRQLGASIYMVKVEYLDNLAIATTLALTSQELDCSPLLILAYPVSLAEPADGSTMPFRADYDESLSAGAASTGSRGSGTNPSYVPRVVSSEG